MGKMKNPIFYSVSDKVDIYIYIFIWELAKVENQKPSYVEGELGG